MDLGAGDVPNRERHCTVTGLLFESYNPLNVVMSLCRDQRFYSLSLSLCRILDDSSLNSVCVCVTIHRSTKSTESREATFNAETCINP